jgi:hypothetical protein
MWEDNAGIKSNAGMLAYWNAGPSEIETKRHFTG